MPDDKPVKRGRKPKAPAASTSELPTLCASALTLWSLREVADVLKVSRKRVAEAVRTNRLPCEPSEGRRPRRVLAFDAVRVLAPAFLSRIKFL